MFVRFTAGLALVGLFAMPAVPQQFDRRARDEPEVVVEAGGRVGNCDVLRFTPDGQFLLAGGDDKVVRVWPHSVNGLDAAPGKAKTLRWRSWRDQLGGIKALGVSPDGKRVVVGGYGLKISSVAILDRETGNTLAITWPRYYVGAPNLDAVMVAEFHPDGNRDRIGFGTADGSLWLWDPVKLTAPTVADKKEGRVWNAPVRVGRFADRKNASGQIEFNFPRSIAFPNAGTLVAVSFLGQVLSCNLDGKLSDDLKLPIPAGKTLFDVNEGLPEPTYPVNHAQWTADGRWLVVATKGPLVLFRSADGKQTVPLELPPASFPRSVAVHPKTGKVAIGVGGDLPTTQNPHFYLEGNDEIWVYDDPTGAKPGAPKKKLSHLGRAEALAFHPVDDRLAIAGGDADEITLLDLANPGKPVSVIHGAGRHLWAVNLSDDEEGAVLGVQTARKGVPKHPNDRGEGPWIRFDVPRFTSTADPNIKWVNPSDESGGWTIVPDKKSRFTWYAERGVPGGKEQIRLGLDEDLDQAPTCYTFVPTAEGKPARVLVGHYYGCSLFELVPERAVKNKQTGVIELPRSKLFIGHGAEVNSIVANKKGTWFVTASSDQTVAGWSLIDWNAQPALGAAFEAKAGRLQVTAVDVGSPAWEAGLTKGDFIEGLAVGGNYPPLYDSRDMVAGSPEAAAEALRNPQSGVELFFSWTTPGQTGFRATPSRIKQRPLWKWFPAFDDRGRLTDSVIWMWHGSYYFTKSINGDRMVGWHLNHPDVDGRPDYHTLERYKEIFLKEGAIAKLIGTRSVAEAMKDALGDNPQRKSFRTSEPIPVDLALKQSVVHKDGVPITVKVNPLGNNLDLLPDRIELWVNDHRFKKWVPKGKEAIEEDVLIPASAFRAGDNRITVLTTNPACGRAERTEFVNNPATAENVELHGVAVGINDYSSHRKAVNGVRAFGDLGCARADATDFTREMLTYRGPGKCFPTGNVTTFLDAAADRKSLLIALDDLRTRFKITDQSLDALRSAKVPEPVLLKLLPLKNKETSRGEIVRLLDKDETEQFENLILEQTDLKKSPVKPDDLLVVFFAGHGDLLTADGKAPLQPPGARGFTADSGLFVFCCPNYTPAKAAATSLTGDELFEALARINCRKLVLLDSCHAGGAIEANLLRRFIPDGQGPFVIAACDQAEKSFEDDKLGHGVFTYAVLEAFGSKFAEADVNRDGSLSPEELYSYVSERVPALMKTVKPGNTQNPICFPPLKDFPQVALVKIKR